MNVFSYIKQISPGKWEVVSKKNKNLGIFPSKKKAKKRLRQIEFFKHKKAQEVVSTFSATMRELRKNNPEKVISFLKNFQQAFQTAMDQNIEDPEQAALLQAKYEI